MKKSLTILLLLFASSALGQTVVIKNAGRNIAWDYPTASIKTFSIVRFEVQYDAAPFIAVGIPATSNDASTLPLHDTYAAPIPNTLSLGNHTVTVRACQATFCGDSAVPLAFAFSEIPVPANERVK